MKKLLFLLPILCVFAAPISANAETAPTAYEMEISTSALYAPAIEAEGGTYVANLYEKTDTAFSNPVKENFNTEGYIFTACGEYIVQYVITDALGAVTTRDVSLKITDVTKPTITLSDVYAEFYDLGEALELLQAQTTDNAAQQVSLTISVSVLGQDATSSIQDGKIVLDKEGEYVVTYTATDFYGNVQTETATFTVVGETPKKEGKKDKGCKSSVAAVFAPLSLVGAAVLARRKKDEKKD